MRTVDVCTRCSNRHRSKVIQRNDGCRIEGACDWCGAMSTDLWTLGFKEKCSACGGNGKADGIGDHAGIYGSDNCGACGGSGRM